MALIQPPSDLGQVDYRPRLEGLLAVETAEGWRIQARTETTAQLIHPKTFNAGWFLVWMFCSLGTLWWVYLIYWAAGRRRTMYLELRQDGWINRNVDGYVDVA